MSFLDSGERQFSWLDAPAKTSWHLAPGCSQCGRTLDGGDLAGDNLSGKCLGCTNWVSEEDDGFDMLEG